MPALARDVGGEPHQLDPLGRAPCRRSARPSGGASGAFGERDREFEPLQVAIGELAAGPLGRVRHADEGEQRLRLRPRARARRTRQSRPSAPACGQAAPTCTFSRTLIDAKVAVIWKVRPTPSAPDLARRRGRSCRARRSGCGRYRAATWPFSMLKQVDLPAPFGPISASSSPARARRRRRARPARRRRISTGARPGGAARSFGGAPPTGGAAGRRRGRPQTPASEPTMPAREGDDEQHDEQPEHELRIIRLAHQRRSSAPGTRSRRRPRPTPSRRRRAAPSRARRPRAGCRGCPGKTLPLRKANSAPGERREAARDHEGRPLHAAAGRCPIASARSVESRTRPQRVAEGREGHDLRSAAMPTADEREREPVERGRASRPRRGGQTPRMPLSPPVTAVHWKATDQAICAKASVSMAK